MDFSINLKRIISRYLLMPSSLDQFQNSHKDRFKFECIIYRVKNKTNPESSGKIPIQIAFSS